MSDLIKLAEAMKLDFYVLTPFDGIRIKNANGTDTLFDPFTDANDCEALIKFLYPEWTVKVVMGDADSVHLYRRKGAGLPKEVYWQGHKNDWKQGVCELALKVLT